MSDEILIKSSELIGKTVGNAVGGKLGTIREVYVDRESGTAQFAIIDTGGLFGSGGKFHPIPWRLFRFDPGAGTYATSLTKDRLHEAPAYDRDQLNSAVMAGRSRLSDISRRCDAACPGLSPRSRQ